MAIGRYTDILRAKNGDLRPGTPVTVYDTATALPATLYRDSLGDILADNPIYSDTDTAEIQFYAEEGFYSFVVDGQLYIDGVVVFPLNDLVPSGDVTGPASSTDSAITRFDGVTGKVIQNSGTTLSDTGTLKLQPQGSAPAYADGNLWYDSTTGTLKFTNENSDLTLQIGHQVRIKVHNFNGFTFAKGSAVFINGSTATPPYLPAIDVAHADDGLAAESIGLLLDDIGPDSDGYVIVQGLIEGVDTTGFFEGQYVYLSTTPGGLTGTPPHQPNYSTLVGIAANIDATNGTIFVFPSPTQIGHGGSNQYLALDIAGNNQVYRSLAGTAGRLTVTHSPTAATFDVDPTLSNAKVDKSTLSAKGSLISATAAATPVDVPVGSDNQVLTADSSQASGVRWASNAGGNVTGPGSATDNAITRFDGTSGTLIQNSNVTVSDTGTVKLTSQAAPSYADGNLWYDSTSKTLNFTNADSNIVLPIGQQIRQEVFNPHGFSVAKGAALTDNGNIGVAPYTPAIDTAKANDEVRSNVVGLALETIGASSNGFILVEGLLENVDTSAFTEGDILYLSATVDGGLTNTPPQQPNFRTFVGAVVKAHATLGSIFVTPSITQIGHGTSNQYLAVDTGGNNQVYRSLLGTAGRLTVTHSGTAATFDVDSTLSNSKVDKSTLSGKGSLISATAAATPVDVPVGTNQQILRVNTANANDLEWHTLTPGDIGAVPNTRLVQTTNGILGGAQLTTDVLITPQYGTTSQTICEGNDSRVVGAQQRSTLTTKGDLYVASGSATTVRQGVGTNGQFLTADSAQTSGVSWTTATAAGVGAVPTTRNVNTTNGLSGGGALSADLTLQPTYGTTSGTVAQGDDTRIVNAVQGPASATDSAITLWNGTTGKLAKDSLITVTSTGAINLPVQTLPGIPTANRLIYSGKKLVLAYNDPGVNQVNLGQQIVTVVHNNSGSDINGETPVYITGDTGSPDFFPTIAIASSSSVAASKVAGFTIKKITDGDDGYIVSRGIANVTTTGFAVGDTLYLNGGVASNTSPTNSNLLTRLGTVVKVGAGTSGFINTQIEQPKNDFAAAINPNGNGYQPAGGIAVARSNAAITLNQMFLLPVVLLRSGTLTSIQIEVTGTTTSSVTRAGFYGANVINTPTGSPLADFGTIATDTTGVKSWSVSFAMAAGTVYYLALVGQVAATGPNLRLFTGYNPYVYTSGGLPTGANAGWNVAFTQTGVSGALPSIGSLGTSNAPVAGLLF